MLRSLFRGDPLTRLLLFTGKGGVGKTTLASATAVALADAGRRVLLVSTDPASNLNDVLRVSAGHLPTSVPEVGRLFVMNVDPEAAALAYRERVVTPYRIALPEAQVRALEEQLSGQCTVEVAAFDEFTRLLVDPSAEFDHVVFDTAPTGHTLRLLSLPSAWSTYLQTSTAGASCLGPLAGLEAQRTHYEAAVAALADPVQTTLVLVSRPDRGDLREAARASQELAALGIGNQRLALNGVFANPLADDRVAEALAQRQRDAIEAMPEALRALPRDEVPLTAGDLIGLAALRGLVRDQGSPVTPAEQLTPRTGPPPLGLGDLVRELSALGLGAVLVMGKGGVGKTTIACAVALGLVRLGHEVDLSTTDPAGRWEDSITANLPSGLAVSRIDPAQEVQRYARERLDAAGELDPQQRALLEEDLRSPCTQEIAVFGPFGGR